MHDHLLEQTLAPELVAQMLYLAIWINADAADLNWDCSPENRCEYARQRTLTILAGAPDGLPPLLRRAMRNAPADRPLEDVAELRAKAGERDVILAEIGVTDVGDALDRLRGMRQALGELAGILAVVQLDGPAGDEPAIIACARKAVGATGELAAVKEQRDDHFKGLRAYREWFALRLRWDYHDGDMTTAHSRGIALEGDAKARQTLELEVSDLRRARDGFSSQVDRLVADIREALQILDPDAGHIHGIVIAARTAVDLRRRAEEAVIVSEGSQQERTTALERDVEALRSALAAGGAQRDAHLRDLLLYREWIAVMTKRDLPGGDLSIASNRDLASQGDAAARGQLGLEVADLRRRCDTLSSQVDYLVAAQTAADVELRAWSRWATGHTGKRHAGPQVAREQLTARLAADYDRIRGLQGVHEALQTALQQSRTARSVAEDEASRWRSALQRLAADLGVEHATGSPEDVEDKASAAWRAQMLTARAPARECP